MQAQVPADLGLTYKGLRSLSLAAGETDSVSSIDRAGGVLDLIVGKIAKVDAIGEIVRRIGCGFVPRDRERVIKRH